MEDSGIDSDSKTVSHGMNYAAVPDHDEEDIIEIKIDETTPDNTSEKFISLDTKDEDSVYYKGFFKKIPKMKPASLLQKRLEKQMLQIRKFRQKEQSLEGLPKKLIPRNRLKVPKGQTFSTKADSHPLVSWETESDEEMDYHPISKSNEISEHLIKDEYNLDLTPDDEDLDLIPPKPPTNKCICCSLNCMCLIQ